MSDLIRNPQDRFKYMKRPMGKPTICLAQISFAVTAKLINAIVFATWIVLFLLYLNRKLQASSSFLCSYRPVCVRPVRKPHCWFSTRWLTCSWQNYQCSCLNHYSFFFNIRLESKVNTTDPSKICINLQCLYIKLCCILSEIVMKKFETCK